MATFPYRRMMVVSSSLSSMPLKIPFSLDGVGAAAGMPAAATFALDAAILNGAGAVVRTTSARGLAAAMCLSFASLLSHLMTCLFDSSSSELFFRASFVRSSSAESPWKMIFSKGAKNCEWLSAVPICFSYRFTRNLLLISKSGMA